MQCTVTCTIPMCDALWRVYAWLREKLSPHVYTEFIAYSVCVFIQLGPCSVFLPCAAAAAVCDAVYSTALEPPTV